jgi:hypothetical protein
MLRVFASFVNRRLTKDVLASRVGSIAFAGGFAPSPSPPFVKCRLTKTAKRRRRRPKKKEVKKKKEEELAHRTMQIYNPKF